MARKKKTEEHENHERWMVSYADFVTLLFAFFTCLYAISTVDAAKMGQMVASMKVSFGGQIFDGASNTISLFDNSNGASISAIYENPETGTGDSSPDEASAKTLLSGEAAMGRFKRTLEAMLSEEIRQNLVRIHLERRGIIISLSETSMFDSGSDVIRPEGIATLDIVATSLTTIGNHIRVEGHADSVPINTARFPSNWELSTARAHRVMYRMVSNYGMSPQHLSVSGYGEWRPVASNSTAEGRAKNRRVDIVILNPAYAQLEPL